MASRSAIMETHYDTLSVSRTAPPEVIRAAYRSLSQKHHPDRNPGAADSDRIMLQINTAYTVLCDPARKREHDSWIAEQEARRARQPPERAVAGDKSLVPKSVAHVHKRYAWTWRIAAVAILIPLFAFFFTPSVPTRDAWLERAWKQGLATRVDGTRASAGTTPAGVGQIGASDRAAEHPLKLETSLASEALPGGTPDVPIQSAK